jgi:beta propeller repeat protein
VANYPQNVPAERWIASAGLALAILLVAGSGAQPGDRSPRASEALLVRFHAEGPHALTGCAEARSRTGQPFIGVTADRSDSLDRLHRQLGVRGLRAVFRRPDGRALPEQRRDLRRRLAGPLASDAVPDLSHVYRVRLARAADVERAVALYAADPHVAWAQPDFAVDLDAMLDDPFLASGDAWGQGYGDLWGLERIRAPEAWERSRGEGVVVAVVDSGVDYEHPDLADNVWVNPGEDLDGNGRVDPEDWNGIDDDDNGYVDDLHGFDFANSFDGNGDGDFEDGGDWNDPDPFDDNGHGSHVAGTVAAVGDNGIGVIGVAPRARIMALKGFPASGATTIEVLARAMVYAVENGARVINNSWSCSRRCPHNPIAEEAVALAAARGVVVVTSAGNKRDDVVFYSPEKLRETIVVGASDSDDAAAGFSNRGLLMDVMAPGSGAPSGSGFFPQRAILSLLSSEAGPAADGFGAFVVGGGYLRWSGTSMSAPHVAGVAALLLAQQPELDPEGVRARLRAGARDLGAAGHDARFGAGLVDALRALDAAPPDLSAHFDDPEPGAIVVPGEQPLPVRGRVLGADLTRWTLDVGAGVDPKQWQTLASDAAPAADELARWDLSGWPAGAYALRLSAQARDGRMLQEFLPLALERALPEPVSFGADDAARPRVSGELVVWESELRGEVDAEGHVLGLDLHFADLSQGTSGTLVSAPGDQRAAALDDRSLVWLDGREHSHELFGCEIDAEGGCEPRPVATGAALRQPPALAGERVAWSELVPGEGLKLQACEGATGGQCEPLALSLAGTQAEPSWDGDQLLWVQRSASSRLTACDLSAGRCDAAPLNQVLGATQPAADAGLVAWRLLSGGAPLLACAFDPLSHACPAQLIDARAATGASISGDRLVWQASVEGGSDILFCEFDRRTDSCPPQRLTGSLGDERNPHIDGDRVVWEDDRQGLFQIYGLSLPRLEPIPDQRVVSGRPLKLRVAGSDPAGGELALSAALADGRPVEALGMRFRELARGKGQLTWRARGTGAVDVTFTGTDVRGLSTRRTVRIEVEPSAHAVR